MSPTDTCPLCDVASAARRYDLQYEDIWTAIAQLLGTSLPDDVVRRNTPAASTSLVECRSCGLEYFIPVAPGDATFYEALDEGAAYYHEKRWDMEVVAEAIPTGATVLDVGCGRGAFLDMVRHRTQRAVGVDQNRDAVATLQRQGREAIVGDIFEVAATEPHAFDVVTALHVVEHLPHVGRFIDAAVTCLRPAGSLVVVVPNREHYALNDFEPLDCPPHHVSRWAQRQFEEIAGRHELDLCGIRLEPLPVPTTVHIIAARTLRRLMHRQSPEHRMYAAGLLRRMRYGLSMVGWFVTP